MRSNGEKNMALDFPSIPRGEKSTPLDLTMFLYRGGPSLGFKNFQKARISEALGDFIEERLDLVRKIHAVIGDDIAAGGSVQSARTYVDNITALFKWGDENHKGLTTDTIEETYIDYTENLSNRVRMKVGLSEGAAYGYAVATGRLIDKALERATPIVLSTRLKRPKALKTPLGKEADKMNLKETFSFGHLLQDICDAISLEVIWNERTSVSVKLRQGGKVNFSKGKKANAIGNRTKNNIVASKVQDLEYRADRTLNHSFRVDMVNLRIQAELLMFIGQTSMNLVQAQNLTLRKFSYSSDIDGYKVRDYKNRRGGEVLFEIFSEYRAHFERYLDWRRSLFPNEELLFPLIRRGAHQELRPSFFSIQGACKQAGIQWTTPRMLRGTRINWILRRSGDPNLAADIAQHDERTLLTVYEQPSAQRAISEITRFHFENDPALVDRKAYSSVAPGGCNGDPAPSALKPLIAPSPNCSLPSGCLWCDHHRDIDSFDYVWALGSFRHLKIIEISKTADLRGNVSDSPAELTAKILGDKIQWFQKSNETRRGWVEEALMRVDEGDYHQQWSYLIEAVEGKWT